MIDPTSLMDLSVKTKMRNLPHFMVSVRVHVPYPRSFEYIIPASSFGTAINRATKMVRKELGRKKIVQIYVSANRLPGA